MLRRSFLARNLWYREIIPDPRGLVSLALALGLLISHLSLASGPVTHLWSEDPVLEALGHLWFIVGPPLSLFLGLRHLVVSGDSTLPFLSVPLSLLLTAATGVGILWAFLAG